MTHRVLLTTLLLAATALADLAALDSLDRQGAGSPAMMLTVALAASQTALLALWLALGRGSLTPRVVAALAGLGFWIWRMSAVGSRDGNVALAVFGAELVILAVAALALRAAGGRLPPVEASDAHRGAADRPPLQFSLRTLLAWMTVMSVGLAIARQVDVDRQTMRFAWSLAGGLVLVAILAAWSVLADRPRPATRLAITSLAAPAVMCLALAAMSALLAVPATRPLYWKFAVLGQLHALLTAGSLAVFRQCGHRLVGHRRAEWVGFRPAP